MTKGEIRTLDSPVGAEITLDGRRYVNFGGSSYLGLSAQPAILEAGVAALRQGGSGYQLARHFRIASAAHQRAESVAASFFKTEAAMFLPNGYLFGSVGVGATRGVAQQIFYDELSHFCLREAIAASGLPSFAFRHLDADDLGSQLKRRLQPRDVPLVVTDGMYSTLGEIAPLDRLAEEVVPYDGWLLVDESHSFGVLGAQGQGATEHHGIATRVLRGGSTGKALGVLGGLAVGTVDEIERCRTTSAGRAASVGLPAAAAMCAASLTYFREHPELLERLRENTRYMKKALSALGLKVGGNLVPVAAFVAGDRAAMRRVQERLLAEGIYVLYSNYIGAGAQGVLRCGIFADHTRGHIDALVAALRRSL